MSTKASTLTTSANNSPGSPEAMSNATTSVSGPSLVKIKKEIPSDEIKEYAESTMNELLGWYGFDSVDRLDISAKTTKILQSAALINAQQNQQHLERRRSRSSRASAHLQQLQNEQRLRSLNAVGASSGSNTNNNNNNNSLLNNNNNNSSSNISGRKQTLLNVNNYRGTDSTASDHDTRSSRDDDSKSPHSTGKLATAVGASSAAAMEEKMDFQNCCWCRRPVPENAPEFLTTSDGPRYCSESCFTQSRRANFKKAKTCDWCKHVRHAVSYVDFQDGASQLQFCSDKCLNQYKMQIFCKETQAHLDMNPHLKEHGLKDSHNGANLITPELWLRNCRSRSASPASTISLSPGPNTTSTNIAERSNANTPISPPKIIAGNNNVQQQSGASYKPMISVAPVSKLMSKSPVIMSTRHSPKHSRKKRPIRACNSLELSTGNRAENKNACLAAGGAAKSKTLPETNRGSLPPSNSQTLTQFATSCVQDLQMNVPPLSPMLESPASQSTTPHSLPPNGGRLGTAIPPSFFATPANSVQAPVPPPGGFPVRPPFLHAPGPGFLPRFLGNYGALPQLPASIMMPPELSAFNALVGTPPPVTVMMPYPIIIPLPIPIPVPLPIVDFYKAHLSPEERRKFMEEQKIKSEMANRETSQHNAETEQPLDFTKTKCSAADARHSEETPAQHALEEDTNQMTCSSSSSTTPSDDSLSANSKTLHCVISEDVAAGSNDAHRPRSGTNEANDDSPEEGNQKLPKLKITRLQTKRTLIQTKESECSRPLRKRKRIIDCDFQKMVVASAGSDREQSQESEEVPRDTDNGQTNA